MSLSRIALILACAAAAAGQQQPQKQSPAQGQERDLKIEKIEPAATPAPTPPKTVTVPRSYAAIVGMNYERLPEAKRLHFAERDAQAIYTILISPEGGGFKAENVHVLSGPDATLANMRKEIDNWLPSVAQPDDRVLIYFAGHGFVYQGKGYLAPYDVDLDNIGATGYPMDELGLVIGSKIRAKYKILLTDSCHSGAISLDDTQSLNHTLSTLQNSLFSLTASRDREQSFEDSTLEGGHGVFTYYVVKGLEGAADTSGDAVVTADELAEYVHTQVREYTGNKQNPTSDRGSFDPEMLLSYVPSSATPAAPPAPKFGSLVFETNMDEVEVYLDGKSIGVLSKGKPFAVPGLPPGEHTVKGVRMGYEPDGPRQETVYPGQESTVSIKILIAQRRNKKASDLLDKGVDVYQHASQEKNYKTAAEYLEQALAEDPAYSKAAYYLGLTYSALFDYDKAAASYKKAIQIDPDYLEARANYAGMLFDTGDVDESLRQVNAVLQRDPKHVAALTMQARGYLLKGLYAESIVSARKAIKLAPDIADAHMWLADSLRLSGKFAEARPEYDRYLALSNFDSGLAGQLNWVLGFVLPGMGNRKRASTKDIWQDLRSEAYFGICDCERNVDRFDAAIASCQKSLTYDPKYPFAHYALGLAYMGRYNLPQGGKPDLAAAERHLQQMLDLNGELAEAKYARQDIIEIRKVLAAR
jgi:tetratricopeptide (TPR) repeat protein